MADSVNHPSHYNTGEIEVIDAIEDWGLGFHLGNTVKYVARAGHKGSELEDLKKAAWYLDRKIKMLEGSFTVHIKTNDELSPAITEAARATREATGH